MFDVKVTPRGETARETAGPHNEVLYPRSKTITVPTPKSRRKKQLMREEREMQSVADQRINPRTEIGFDVTQREETILDVNVTPRGETAGQHARAWEVLDSDGTSRDTLAVLDFDVTPRGETAGQHTEVLHMRSQTMQSVADQRINSGMGTARALEVLDFDVTPRGETAGQHADALHLKSQTIPA